MCQRLVILLSAALLATGCTVTTDLGKPCVLKKTQEVRDTNGIVTGTEVVSILQSELGTGQDYIAFGITECDDLICVRDADEPFLEEPADPNQPRRTAVGYCSRACIEGSDASACEVTDSSVPADLSGRMACRSLLLDTQTLERLRADDPAAYRRTFGETLSPFFCAGNLKPKT
ncbi:MAG TPA: adventurous gliding motility lipoprotein CglC [Myxococcaceae bacterium]|nr:adventurous gliding motility lipoprotein CglC [Myxococcaceae bacterium]